MQELAPFVFDSLSGLALEKRLVEVGSSRILALMNRLSRAGLAHCDLNPGNLVLMRGGRLNLGVIDLAATTPDFCKKTGVRWKQPPRSKKRRITPQSREEQLSEEKTRTHIQNLWKQALMMHKFIHTWKRYSEKHTEFKKHIWSPIYDTLTTFKTSLRNLLRHAAHPESPISDRALLDIDVFYWGGDSGFHETHP